MTLCQMMNIYNHPQAIFHRFIYFYYTEFLGKDHTFNIFFSKVPQFLVIYNTNINSDSNNVYISFFFLNLLKVYENYNIQEKNLSEKMNKIDEHPSNKHPYMKMNFITIFSGIRTKRHE